MPYQPRACLVRLPIISLVMWCAAAVGTASAQTTSEHGASLLVFPKIVADATADTVVQVANLLESRVDVFCTYVDGAAAGRPPASAVVADRRAAPALGGLARAHRQPARTDTNAVPAAPADLRGELLCVEVDGTGAPSGGNRLVGRATRRPPSPTATRSPTPPSACRARASTTATTSCASAASRPTPAYRRRVQLLPGRGGCSPSHRGRALTSSRATARRSTRGWSSCPARRTCATPRPARSRVISTVTNEFAAALQRGAVKVTCWADLSLGRRQPAVQPRRARQRRGADAPAPGATSGGFVVLAESERRAAGGAVVSRDALVPQQEGAAAASPTPSSCPWAAVAMPRLPTAAPSPPPFCGLALCRCRACALVSTERAGVAAGLPADQRRRRCGRRHADPPHQHRRPTRRRCAASISTAA